MTLLQNNILNYTKISVMSKLVFLSSLMKILARSGYTHFRSKNKRYPHVVQLPITYQCNSKCIMCNVWKMDYSNELSPEKLCDILKDDLFKNVKSVGINGGEPTLKKNLIEYVKSVLKIPEIKDLNIITHGFNKKSLLESSEKIKELCKRNGVKFHISISLDGYRNIHNKVRGMPVFNITADSVNTIKNNLQKYADSMDVGCTVVRQNVNHLIELDAYAKKNNLEIKYRLGIPNKRIQSDRMMEHFSSREGQYLQSAKEFFYSRFLIAKNFSIKFKYYAIFSHLINPEIRHLGCDWQDQGVTLDSKGKLFYCAVESEEIGDARKGSASQYFFDKNNLRYRKNIIENKCDNCIHDYSGTPRLYSVFMFLKEILFHKFWASSYQARNFFP